MPKKTNGIKGLRRMNGDLTLSSRKATKLAKENIYPVREI